MKRASSHRQFILLLFLLIVVILTACTRPARTDTAATPAVTPGAIQPTVDPALVTPIVPPTIQPTVDPNAPVAQPTVDPNAPVATVDPNAPTVAPGTTPVAVETPTSTGSTPGTYQVQSGDTMGKIAEQLGISLQDLLAANPQITNPDSIQVGDVINLPGAGSSAGTPVPQGERVHVVQAGENLYRIGLLYGCTIDQLVQHNGLTNPDSLEVGQQIRIPVCE